MLLCHHFTHNVFKMVNWILTSTLTSCALHIKDDTDQASINKVDMKYNMRWKIQKTEVGKCRSFVAKLDETTGQFFHRNANFAGKTWQGDMCLLILPSKF